MENLVNWGHCISVHSANPRGCDGLDGLFGDPQGAQECRVAGAKGGQLVGTRNIHLAKQNWYFSHYLGPLDSNLSES